MSIKLITIRKARIAQKGMLADNTTKADLYIPELPDDQMLLLIKLIKSKQAAIIIMEPEALDDIIDVLKQVGDYTISVADKEVDENTVASDPGRKGLEQEEEEEEYGNGGQDDEDWEER